MRTHLTAALFCLAATGLLSVSPRPSRYPLLRPLLHAQVSGAEAVPARAAQSSLRHATLPPKRAFQGEMRYGAVRTPTQRLRATNSRTNVKLYLNRGSLETALLLVRLCSRETEWRDLSRRAQGRVDAHVSRHSRTSRWPGFGHHRPVASLAMDSGSLARALRIVSCALLFLVGRWSLPAAPSSLCWALPTPPPRSTATLAT